MYMYPPIEPYKIWMMPVGKLGDSLIQVYVEFSGNQVGVPVVYLHGGPGDRSSPDLRRIFDPKKYNIILFDQRGCGRSRPRNHLVKNTTSHLLSDIARIQDHVGEKIVVAGGSWGTSLALTYAIKHPTRVLGLILRGVYDLSPSSAVLNAHYPEDQAALLKLVPNKTYYKSIDRILKAKNAKTRKLVRLLSEPNSAHVKPVAEADPYADQYTLALVGNHYEGRGYFLPKTFLYKNLKRIKDVPVYMVSGRQDVITPTTIAYHVCKHFKKCKLKIVEGAGHAASEVAEAMTEASDAFFKNIISKK